MQAILKEVPPYPIFNPLNRFYLIGLGYRLAKVRTRRRKKKFRSEIFFARKSEKKGILFRRRSGL
jgi:hypothetical protein